MTKIILSGYMGQMGKVICTMANNDPHCEIVGGVDIVGSVNGMCFPTYQNIGHCDRDADVVIDFSVVEAIPDLLAFSIRRQIPLILCTTGFSAEVATSIRETSERVAVLQSANMSIGINLLSNIVSKAAKLLSEANFDIEIVEKHHNKKVDAPSGTALLLANTINNALEGRMDYKYDRSHERKNRKANEIGIHTLRGGTIVGEHSVIFAGEGEVLEFTHQAQSKDVFAAGALSAAKFMKGKPPGFYTMNDVVEAVE